jgi:hypothetical protein
MLLLREITVWKRVTDVESVRYTCFESLETGRFCVQVADFVRLPLDDVVAHQQRRLRTELLLEGQLGACSWHATLVEAINAHDADFGDGPFDLAEH